ncbi:natural resistance-associated macrophage protein-domain-containing protein [Mycena metata]|uniref:Natural resistance-associated macrophage protein-domain-containing protein n=1 Tax=Mycena metata TaxID=1033252 RepID=A0AAD7ITQ3_9AGAR|nr:natural resistance-associated macrophage protein-domain-containing protein [Mycena metata]
MPLVPAAHVNSLMANSQSDHSLTSKTLSARLRSASSIVVLHAKKHVGTGVLCSVAYFDPGNWSVDLQAGSRFGFRLLFVVLIAGLFAAFLQVLATKLGCVTGLDLASHCRVLLYDRPKHPLLYRRLVLYPLYFLSEVAIISTDLAELLGSAIALCLLFPKLDLWQAVLITAFDVIFLLALRDPLRSTPVKMFEMLIAGLVGLATLICMVIVIAKVDVSWGKAFDGFLPSKFIFSSSGLYTAVGILGATVMPHSLFLGSALATQDRLSVETPPPVIKPESIQAANARDTTLKTLRNSLRLTWIKEFLASLFRTPPPSRTSTSVKQHADRENNSFIFIRAHLNHQIVDVVGSLLGFAVLINSLILILASTVFFYGRHKMSTSASLFDAYKLIHDIVGVSAATVFAIALLAAGQSSSVIATIAGQAVSEGFLNWRVSPITRRLLTRLIAVIPSMAVAIAVGRPGIDTLLVASQVILAVVLPFITLPLIYLTSSKTVMRVRKPDALVSTVTETDNTWDDTIDYSNGTATTIVACGIWLVMLTANLYVIVTLIMGAL